MTNSDQAGDETQPRLQFCVIPVTPLQQNASIVWSAKTKEAVIVDPGGDADRIVSAVEELKLSASAIWLTHGHIDHVGAAGMIRKELRIPIIGPHAKDQFLLDSIEAESGDYGITGAINFTPDRYLKEGDKVQLSEIEFDVYECPGHTPGHIVFVQPEEAFALVGDVLFCGSVGRSDFPYSSPADLIHSIVHKLWPLGKEIRFLPGHGPMSTFGEERLHNAFVSDSVIGI